MKYFLHQIEHGVDRFFEYWPRARPGQAQLSQVRVVAHRGAHDGLAIQENTHQAFERAYQLGCWGIELDVHATRDQILVVNHDATLKRLWGHNVLIRDKSYAELQAIAPDLPTLQEVVARYGHRMHLFIELKAPFQAFHVLEETLKPLVPEKAYHLISLDETVFEKLKAFPKKAFLLVPQHNNVRKFCHLSIKKQYGGILGHYFLLSKKQIKALKAAHQMIGVGFIDSKNSLYRAIERETYYVFTNQSAVICQIVCKNFRIAPFKS